jgi:hypothetical protein
MPTKADVQAAAMLSFNASPMLAVILEIQKITFEAPRDTFNPEDIMMQSQALEEIADLVKDYSYTEVQDDK